MFVCECGGILIPVAVEQAPEELPKIKRIVYDRVCDVECQKCGKIHYSQPYDNQRQLNLVRKANQLTNDTSKEK